MNIEQLIAIEIGAKPEQVASAVALLDKGDSVPFVARYRKDVTGGLDDVQLRVLEKKLSYLRELVERKDVVLNSIDSQGKLTAEIRELIASFETKTALEDFYLPFKPRRTTKGQLAIEAGIEPFVDDILLGKVVELSVEAVSYINPEKNFAEVAQVLDGALHVLMDRVGRNGVLIAKIREYLFEHGDICSEATDPDSASFVKFKDYFAHREKIKSIPAHRMLALMRGMTESALSLSLVLSEQDADETSTYFQQFLRSELDLPSGNAELEKFFNRFLRLAWRAKLSVTIQNDIISTLKERSDAESIDVFGNNLKDLLMAAPAGDRITLGLDPGFKSGVKFAVVDQTGMLLDHGTIFPHPPQNQLSKSIGTLKGLVTKYKIALVAIGNGTASRETERLVNTVHEEVGGFGKVVVSEAGASVYSASELAAEEFPALDVSIRGAISIARRLQDPLAELVKIDPKAIGVGQYQHDVCQFSLVRTLDAVVEDCVNNVGVDLNTASAPLLSHVSGLSLRLAKKIVEFRESAGAYKRRDSLKSVSGVGEKVYEQCAGFLKIAGGENPLDATIVHPESYPLVEAIIKDLGVGVGELVGNKKLLTGIDAKNYDAIGYSSVVVDSVLSELAKPARDPRPEFKTATFKDGVEKITDLKSGMILQGVVTNVANFGAFVDIGVHQDGLVHISSLADKFVSNPRDVVKTGDVVRVKVMDVKPEEKRIALSMRLSDDAVKKSGGIKAMAKNGQSSKVKHRSVPSVNGAMADAFSRAKVS